MMVEGVAHRIVEQALVTGGYRIWRREPYLDVDDELTGTTYVCGHLDVRGEVRIVILDEDADDEVVGWRAATDAVALIAAW